MSTPTTSARRNGSSVGISRTTPAAPRAAFSITAKLGDRLYPGAAPEPLDLSVKNPNGRPISITSLIVGIGSITLSANPPVPGRCTPTDFEVQQFSGALPIRVAAGETVTLSTLGVPPSEMPLIRMVDRPYDQDGCQGATVNLTYGGTATG